MDLTDLRKAVEEVELVDAHAHNLVDLDSNLAFIHAFSEANGDAISFAPHSLSFKVLFLLFLLSQYSHLPNLILERRRKKKSVHVDLNDPF